MADLFEGYRFGDAWDEMFAADGQQMLATTEQMLMHVDMNAGRSAPILPDVNAALVAITAAHQTLPPAKRAGHFSLTTE